MLLSVNTFSRRSVRPSLWIPASVIISTFLHFFFFSTSGTAFRLLMISGFRYGRNGRANLNTFWKIRQYIFFKGFIWKFSLSVKWFLLQQCNRACFRHALFCNCSVLLQLHALWNGYFIVLFLSRMNYIMLSNIVKIKQFYYKTNFGVHSITRSGDLLKIMK